MGGGANNKAKFISVAVTTEGEQSRTIPGSPPQPPPDVPRPWLWIAGQSCEVLAFALTARNNDAPIINIQGSLTNLTGPQGNDFSESYAVAIGPDKRIYVIGGYNTTDLSTWINNLNVFAPTADGNVAPVQTISGNLTLLGTNANNVGICVDDSSNVYTSEFFSGSLFKFVDNATGNIAPTTLVTIANEAIVSLYFDSATQLIWMLTLSQGGGADNSIRSCDLSGTLMTHIHGASTTLSSMTLAQIFLDGSGNIYVSGSSTSTFDDVVTVFASGSDGNVTPSRSFKQTLWTTTPTAYQGIALDGDGNAYMSATTGEAFGPGSNNRTIQIVPASSSGTVTATGMMTNMALGQMDDGAGTTPVQMAVG